MAKNQPPPISVKDTVYRLQLSLLQGLHGEDQLFAAGSIMSRSDYNDVVTERSIANLCGYPLCPNPLPSDRPRKGRYRISLKEHKVYDLHETYMYCSSDCVINSRTFAASLKDERCAVLDSARIDAVLRMFEDYSGLERELGFGKDRDLGFSKLKIEEKTENCVGDVSLEQWAGPSNAIEGYVLQRERKPKELGSKSPKRGSKANNTVLINDMDFVSTIITEDEYTVSKTPSSLKKTGLDSKVREQEEILAKKAMGNEFAVLETSYAPASNVSRVGLVFEDVTSSLRAGSCLSSARAEEESHDDKAEKCTEASIKSSLKPSRKKKLSRTVTWADEKTDSSGGRKLCEIREIEDMKEDPSVVENKNGVSFTSSGKMKAGQSVIWADEKGDSSKSIDVCEVREIEDAKEAADMLCNADTGENDDTFRFASAEACARALDEASEAVASEELEVNDAMSEAGIIILPRPENGDEGEPMEEDDDDETSEPEQAPIKWPKKPGSQHSDLFDPEDSWFDAPPEDFSLTLSPFAKMWNALFTWTTSSTLAYIYGRDESLHEEYAVVNGREYPEKIVFGDGRSSEIKQTLAGSLARALPGLVADLRLSTPISSLEQGMVLMDVCWTQCHLLTHYRHSE
ncbi:putative RNA polymerase II subunit B1 CTD phosphatase RPAP2 homolog isoform X2 [Morus notabilis]|uniref:putative RNA polymerase II subunit B1 CTD phosphatase RPAP2 homolog isoform X2 n=1 Tax=Morus notabilis TaxID=981085 RepID=UPI000CECFAE4|nr:putative RNA polymerase II subunit B1 CTD phosphatase RPAP2 homolog isoform X2 [Morus notabilis]